MVLKKTTFHIDTVILLSWDLKKKSVNLVYLVVATQVYIFKTISNVIFTCNDRITFRELEMKCFILSSNPLMRFTRFIFKCQRSLEWVYNKYTTFSSRDMSPWNHIQSLSCYSIAAMAVIVCNVILAICFSIWKSNHVPY